MRELIYCDGCGLLVDEAKFSKKNNLCCDCIYYRANLLDEHFEDDDYEYEMEDDCLSDEVASGQYI